jgi:hypothetical protein
MSDDAQTSYPVWFVEYVAGVAPLPVPVPVPLPPAPFPLSDGPALLFSLSSPPESEVETERLYPELVNPSPGRRCTSLRRDNVVPVAVPVPVLET